MGANYGNLGCGASIVIRALVGNVCERGSRIQYWDWVRVSWERKTVVETYESS